MKQAIFFPTSCLVLSLVFCNSVFAKANWASRLIPVHPVTQEELPIIEHGDYGAASSVLGRLIVLFQQEGVDSVRIAVPAMQALLSKLQNLEGNNHSIMEGELVAFLGRIGDPSSKQLLLNAVKRDNGNALIGLVKMDSAVDSVTTYLLFESLRIRSKASHTLVRMYRRKPSLFTSDRVKLIRKNLVESLDLHEYKGAICFAFSTFGDSTDIPILINIATTDTLIGLGGRKPNRRFAKYAIDKINQRVGGN